MAQMLRLYGLIGMSSDRRGATHSVSADLLRIGECIWVLTVKIQGATSHNIGFYQEFPERTVVTATGSVKEAKDKAFTLVTQAAAVALETPIERTYIDTTGNWIDKSD